MVNLRARSAVQRFARDDYERSHAMFQLGIQARFRNRKTRAATIALVRGSPSRPHSCRPMTSSASSSPAPTGPGATSGRPNLRRASCEETHSSLFEKAGRRREGGQNLFSSSFSLSNSFQPILAIHRCADRGITVSRALLGLRRVLAFASLDCLRFTLAIYDSTGKEGGIGISQAINQIPPRSPPGWSKQQRCEALSSPALSFTDSACAFATSSRWLLSAAAAALKRNLSGL